MQRRLYPDRLIAVAAVLLFLLAALLSIITRGDLGLPVGCMFRNLTGLHCFGCGMTRATVAVFEGRFGDAFAYNPLGVILFPIALIGVALEAEGWVRGQAPRLRIPLGVTGAKWLVLVIILFTLLRNFPWFPFTMLAPH